MVNSPRNQKLDTIVTPNSVEAVTFRVSYDRIWSALQALNFDDRRTWILAGMCIKSEFNDQGFELWDAWGGRSDKHSAREAKSAWKSFRFGGKLTIATLFYEARQAGWKDCNVYKKTSQVELTARVRAAAVRRQHAEVQEKVGHAQGAEQAGGIWEKASSCASHAYLDRKRVPSYGLRVGPWEVVSAHTGEVLLYTANGLLVPIHDHQGKVWSLQCIHPSPTKCKLYLKGGAKRGHFFCIGSPQQYEGHTVFVLAEGYATGASVHAATGHQVFVCFDLSNLLPVAKDLRHRHHNALMVFAADNDTHTAGNPGLTKARHFAQSVEGIVAVPPPGDFNDLATAAGLDAVKAVFDCALAESAANLTRKTYPRKAGGCHE